MNFLRKLAYHILMTVVIILLFLLLAVISVLAITSINLITSVFVKVILMGVGAIIILGGLGYFMDEYFDKLGEKIRKFCGV